MKEEITLDVKGKSLGRAASEAAVLLRGKNLPDFEPRIRPTRHLTIKNVKGLSIHPTKFRTKVYKDYSGYPGGLKERSLKELWQKNPREVFKRAVWGMLPKNRSRKHIISNLKFE
ncbi:50S ribosomal protein L13 [Candidatus Giovannonibacteria bacterium]|nr:50S ribosomal protein L13 [Candidatus Giovannonibacteria bacterium]